MSAISWCRDGRIVLSYTGKDGILVLDNSKVTRLKEGMTPSWSPDGKQIAYSPLSFLFIMNDDGSEDHPLSDHRGRDPSWSPDGKHIVFSGKQFETYSSTESVCIINLDDGTLEKVAKSNQYPRSENLGSPCWSPDGNMIAFTVWRDIHLLEFATKNTSILPFDSFKRFDKHYKEEPVTIHDLSWSPMTNELAYVDRTFGKIYVVNIRERTLNSINIKGCKAWGVNWSPNTNRLVVLGTRLENNLNRPLIYTMNNDGTEISEVYAFDPI